STRAVPAVSGCGNRSNDAFYLLRCGDTVMRTPFMALAFLATLILPIAPEKAFAGVVVAETSSEQTSNGGGVSINHTVYLQGNKQKIEGQRIATITDLDKSVVYVIDKEQRVYSKLPLKVLSPVHPRDTRIATVDLNRTGKIRIIANHPCS